MYDKSQLMRGTLEGCILKFLSEETTYGYELVEKLEQYGFEDIKEGTIYPLLVRLEKNGNYRLPVPPFSSWSQQKILFSHHRKEPLIWKNFLPTGLRFPLPSTKFSDWRDDP